MKKIILVLLLFLSISIIAKQYLFQTNRYINTELIIPVDIGHHHVEDHNDSHEYFIEDNNLQNVRTFNFAERTDYCISLRLQQTTFYIWQPPEICIRIF